ncbi:TPA: hypothetical protein DDZ10_05125 [Candidatus Uhrbacteria bacterium]|nr:hypothetical protein [Candidatus Uhrbacteria bacterium]
MRSLATLVFLVILSTLTACPPYLEETPPDIIVNEGDTYIDVNVDDDDSAASESDDDSVADILEPTELEVRFTTAFSGYGPMLVDPGASVAMGAYQFIATGEPGTVVRIGNFNAVILTKSDSTDLFGESWNTVDEYPAIVNHIAYCEAISQPDLDIVLGPVYPNEYGNILQFNQGWEIVVEEDGETVVSLQINCQFTETVPEDGNPDGFAMMWESSGFLPLDGKYNELNWYGLTADNGSWNSPALQIWVDAFETLLQIEMYVLSWDMTILIQSGYTTTSMILYLGLYAPVKDVIIGHQEIAIGGLYNPASSGSQFTDVSLFNETLGSYDDGEQMTGYAQEGYAFDDDIVIPVGESRFLQFWIMIAGDATELQPGNTLWAMYNLGALKAYDVNGNQIELGEIIPSTDIYGSTFTITN